MTGVAQLPIPMLSLGLDPSLTGFGWCVHDATQLDAKRVVAKGVFTTSPKEIFVRRYIFMREQVADLLTKYEDIRGVGVESPPFGELWSEGLYGLFLMVNEALYRARKDVVFFDPGTVKMLVKIDPAIRKGKMFKMDMVDAAKQDTGIVKFNHNEADAYHIARFAARFWGLVDGDITVGDLTPAEHKAFAKTHVFTRGKRAGTKVELGAMFKENRRFFRYSALDKP